MGELPEPIDGNRIDPNAWYIAEMAAHGGGDPATGCGRPLLGEIHGVIFGWWIKDWIVNKRDCTDDMTLIGAWGDAQRMLKLFGKWATEEEAWFHMW